MSKNKRVLTGKVLSNKMEKSATVCVERLVKHNLYGKTIKRNTKIIIHDEHNVCNCGDVVVIQETKPFSKCKSFELVSVLAKQS